MAVSIVIPVHCERDNIGELSSRLSDTLRDDGIDAEIIFVDDGSTDDTWHRLRDAAAADPRIRALRLSRNFGHQIALSAGMSVAKGEGVITMDGDLQHPPEMIPAMLAKASEGHDVVYAVRGAVDAEGGFKIRSARLFYKLLNRLTSLDLPIGGGDFRFMSRRVVDALVDMPERHRFLRGMTRWVGFSQAVINYDRGARMTGSSKYTLRRMVRFGTDAIVSFSALPLKAASLVGIVVAGLGGIYFVWTLAIRLFTDEAVAGWTSVMAGVLIIGGVQLVFLGILGQYVGRMYEEDKRRPLFLVWEDTEEPSEAASQHRPDDESSDHLHVSLDG